MVTVTALSPVLHRFELRPNRSATSAQTRVFFWVIAAGTMGVATILAFAGFWLILPFAGLELSVLALTLHATLKRSDRVELIDLDDARIRVTRADHSVPVQDQPLQPPSWQAHRTWARVDLQPSRIRSHPSRLSLRSHGKRHVVGEFLTEGERHGLARLLKQALTGDATFRAQSIAPVPDGLTFGRPERAGE